jgi:glycosyltransferase involved in cell wall biosynthesis
VNVAVVIPCWNPGRLLLDALASVAAQTVPPTQVVVVDDGSTDDAVETASANPAVTLVRQSRSGSATARNTGIARVNAGLVAFLDADDLWPPNSLSVRIAALRETGADGCFGVVEEFRDPADGAWQVRPNSAARLPGSILVTREALARVGGFDPSLQGGECVDWVARFDAAGLRWTKIADVVLHRRIHETNKSRHPQYSQRPGLLEVARRSAARKRMSCAPEAGGRCPGGESD